MHCLTKVRLKSTVYGHDLCGIYLRVRGSFVEFGGTLEALVAEGSCQYLVITLHGKVKGKHHNHCHLIPCVPMTRTGVQLEEALKQLINLEETSGFC